MDFLITIATIVIAVFTYLVWKAYKRIAWFTGAMESHSTQMLKIEAKKAGKEVIWWDPTIEDFPTEIEHKKSAESDTIYLKIPSDLRFVQPETMCYHLGIFVRDFWKKPRECWDDFIRGKNEEPE